jgi:hypothetical protein
MVASFGSWYCDRPRTGRVGHPVGRRSAARRTTDSSSDRVSGRSCPQARWRVRRWHRAEARRSSRQIEQERRSHVHAFERSRRRSPGFGRSGNFRFGVAQVNERDDVLVVRVPATFSTPAATGPRDTSECLRQSAVVALSGAFLNGPAWIRTRDQRIMSLPRRREPPRPDETFPCSGTVSASAPSTWSRRVSAVLFATCLPRSSAPARVLEVDGAGLEPPTLSLSSRSRVRVSALLFAQSSWLSGSSASEHSTERQRTPSVATVATVATRIQMSATVRSPTRP